MSVGASIVSLIIFFTYFLSKDKLSKKWHYYISLIPLVLFVLPLSIHIGLSQNTPSGIIETDIVSEIFSPSETPLTEPTTRPLEAAVQTPETTKNEYKKPIIDLNKAKDAIPYLWLIGFLILTLYQIISRIKLNSYIKKIGNPPSDNELTIFNSMNTSKKLVIKSFDGTSTPFITGIFNPTIMIPNVCMTDYELSFILKHELMHVKRHDLLYKAFADFVCTLHFFNPLVYLFKKHIDELCELSCDEQVTMNMTVFQKKDYITTMLKLMKSNHYRLRTSVAMTQGKKNIMKRMENIMKTRKRSKAISVLSIFLAVMIFCSGTVLASAVNGQNMQTVPKATYQGEFFQTSILNDDDLTMFANFYQRDGVATFTDFMGYTAFKASFFAIPDDLVKTIYWPPEGGVSEQATNIFNDINNYSDYYEIEMDKKVRNYGSGYGIEGLFTMRKNNEIVFEGQKGYLNNLPSRMLTPFRNTTLDIEFMMYDTNVRLSSGMKFVEYTDTSEDVQKQLIRLKNSETTNIVRLGELIEARADDTWIDPQEANERLESPLNNSYITEIQYNKEPGLGAAFFTLAFDNHLYLHGRNLTCTEDTVSGEFEVVKPGLTYDVVRGTISGLLNPVGSFAEFISDDGRYYAKYRISPYIKESLTSGTRDAYEFYIEGEDVFIGTPEEQDKFDNTQKDKLYKRIIIDDNGKVIAVVPIEYQYKQNSDLPQENFNTHFLWSDIWESGITIRSFNENGDLIPPYHVLLDIETKTIRALIPPEFQFDN